MAQKFVRKLQKTGSYSYVINIPKELVDEFGWKERQKLVIEYGGRKHDIVIRDWSPRGADKNNQGHKIQ